MEPRPFVVNVDDAILRDLQERLARTRWPDEVLGTGWQYGTDRTYLRQLVTYWHDVYDWRKSEAQLNSFAQYTVPIDGIDLHFIHEQGVGPAPMPLLLSHGWPGSVWEFHKLIPLLTDPARFGGDSADAFTVVVPSLPGYGFSFRPDQPRFGITETADLFAQLMTGVLGYSRFGAQGGDWGASVTTRLGVVCPERLIGIHLNFLGLLGYLTPSTPATDEEQEYLSRRTEWAREEAGYSAIQGTRPQTLSYGLTDSPVGLAAWLVEKFRAWSDCGGVIEHRFSKDELLTSIMIYWVTGAINSSFWPYYASGHGGRPSLEGVRIPVPMAYAAFPYEIFHPPRTLAERVFDVRRWTPMAAGGHFAALEEPDALAAELRAFYRPLRT